jgi:hypothetical protein
MRIPFRLALLLGAPLLLGQPASAQLGGLLDRVKRKADDAAAEARELRRDVESTTDVEGRAEAEVGRTRAEVEDTAPTEQRIENRVTNEAEKTAAGVAVREAERDVNTIGTADERAEAAARGEVRRTETEIERATDVEGRARGEVERTDAAVTVREAERDVRSVTTADERAQAELERDADAIERSIDDVTSLGAR